MLLYILTELSKEIGIPINTDIDRASALSKVNKAARELYSETDLVGSLREQVFDTDASHLQITLPYYVDHIRAARHYDTRSRVKIEDMRPRYFYGHEWPQKFLTWRKKNRVAIAHELDQESILTITLTAPATERFTVYITGSTSLADRITEAIIFEIGDQTKQTTNQWTQFPGFQFIGKDKVISQNVTLTDINGTTISEIANSEIEASYTLIAIGDYENQLGCDCYEILYKFKFSPFYNDYDNFPAPGYDDAIVYKAASHYWSKDTSPLGQSKVLEYETKCSKIMEDRAGDGEGSDEKELQFGKQRFFDIHGYGYPTGFSADLPSRIF